jgi:spore coat polysaccharide biosynthesis predicted glycosyltransferase SpsG
MTLSYTCGPGTEKLVQINASTGSLPLKIVLISLGGADVETLTTEIRITT